MPLGRRMGVWRVLCVWGRTVGSGDMLRVMWRFAVEEMEMSLSFLVSSEADRLAGARILVLVIGEAT